MAQGIQTKAELLAVIEDAWTTYREGLSTYPDAALQGPTDNAGWTAKDHIAHTTAWETSVTAALHRHPLHEALGVSEDDMALHIDLLNEKIRSAHAEQSLEDVLAESERSHRELVAAIEALSDEAMQHPTGEYIAVSNLASAKIPVADWILGDTAPHYREHLEYIRRIAG